MLATSALSPGEKIRFKNRTLLAYFTTCHFPTLCSKNQWIPVGRGVTKRRTLRLPRPVPGGEGAHRGPASAARPISCGDASTSYPLSWEETVSKDMCSLLQAGSLGSHRSVSTQ